MNSNNLIIKRLFPRDNFYILIAAVITAVCGLISLSMGRYNIPLRNIIEIIMHGLSAENSNINQIATVLLQIRLPRIIAAILIGGALSLSGTAYQSMFRNPMVSPDILGATAGAGFGASIAILLSLNSAAIQLSAFVFGLTAVMLTYCISAAITKGSHTILVLVLTGILISTIFSSLISIIKFTADPESKLPAITFWLMGSLASISMRDLPFLFVPITCGAIPLLVLRFRFNALSFGEEEAKTLGINVARLRPIVIICATLMTSSAVSLSGMIGFVGLVIPHITRLWTGPNHSSLLPISIFTGGTFLLVIDDAARCAFPVEVPLGILTSFVGAPFFLYLLMKGRKSWL
jgi:iron complex transport system permease protein